jgi:hypothetical protein
MADDNYFFRPAILIVARQPDVTVGLCEACRSYGPLGGLPNQ